MGHTIVELRTALQTRLATISGMRAYDIWPDQINCPAALVKPVSMGSRLTFDGLRSRTFEIVFLAAPVEPSLARAQAKLDSYLDDTGSTSIIAAIEADGTLGGHCTDLEVDWDTYGALDVLGIEYLGAKFNVTVNVG